MVSVVGFRFLDTRVLGVRVPWHSHFDEVNLRFYVRRRLPDGELRRGVVFVRELVPRPGSPVAVYRPRRMAGSAPSAVVAAGW
jgi:uncharacterized protein YqjF (DUF2071 family)